MFSVHQWQGVWAHQCNISILTLLPAVHTSFMNCLFFPLSHECYVSTSPGHKPQPHLHMAKQMHKQQIPGNLDSHHLVWLDGSLVRPGSGGSATLHYGMLVTDSYPCYQGTSGSAGLHKTLTRSLLVKEEAAPHNLGSSSHSLVRLCMYI